MPRRRVEPLPASDAGPGLDVSTVGAIVAADYHGEADLIAVLRRAQAEYGHLPEPVVREIARLTGIVESRVFSAITFYAFLAERRQGKFIVRLCRTISCDLQGKDRVARRLENELGIGFGETTGDGMFTLEWTNCLGMCDQGPALLVNDRVLTRVHAESVPGIIAECRHVAAAPARRSEGGASRVTTSVPSATTFSTVEAEAGLKAALSLPRSHITAVLSTSGLKGRGGAGFLTGTKWDFAVAQQSDEKYIVCNADEGEPGTFKDRVILSESADLVFEGMTIAARAIGAREGIVYLRGEYAYLRPHLEAVLAHRRRHGLLGTNVLGVDGFDFDVSVRMGAGAYVCGEETALLESLEGRRGTPRKRPPFPPVSGLWKKPTIIDNVETLAWVACILARGAEWFASIGTETSRGPKLFSVSGDCAAPGVYEFPLGITVSALLDQVGGAGARAVQVGGASGACVPASEFGRRLAFEDLPAGGSVIVFGPERDVLAVVCNFLEFFADESCGKCVPCRIGTKRMYEIVKRVTSGEAELADIDRLERLAAVVKRTSFCGLGQTAPNPVLSTLTHFRHEYEERIVKE